MKLLSPENYTEMPWKNGGGVTREVALAEDTAGFLWRLSIADVSVDGPFSAFPGRDRILTVIEGAGMHLADRDSGVQYPAHPYQPVRFRGEQAIDASLIDGAIRDFNVMYNAARLAADVTVIQEVHGEVTAMAIYCLAGPAHLNSHPIQTGETALFDSETLIAIEGDATTSLLAISIRG